MLLLCPLLGAHFPVSGAVEAGTAYRRSLGATERASVPSGGFVVSDAAIPWLRTGGDGRRRFTERILAAAARSVFASSAAETEETVAGRLVYGFDGIQLYSQCSTNSDQTARGGFAT